MKFIAERNLTEFQFWSGAKENVKMLTTDELEQLDYLIEDAYGDELTETQINDMFWFDFDQICELLGYEYDIETDTIKRLK